MTGAVVSTGAAVVKMKFLFGYSVLFVTANVSDEGLYPDFEAVNVTVVVVPPLKVILKEYNPSLLVEVDALFAPLETVIVA